MDETAWHECGQWMVRADGGPGFWDPSCGGEFTCDECGELVGWCCGGSEDWVDKSKPDPGVICNECWVEHYGEERD